MDELDPNTLLLRLVRGTTFAASPDHADKIRALSTVSAVGAAAYAHTRARTRRPAPHRPPANAAAPLSEDTEAAIFAFHAMDAGSMIRAMVAAAAVDDETSRVQENRRILAFLRDAGASPGQIEFAQSQMQHAATVVDLARGVTSHETAVEIYAAALLATNGATPETRRFLGDLAGALKLDPGFVADLHAQWGDPPPLF